MNFAPIVLTYEPRAQMQQQQQITPSNPRPLSVKRIYSQTPQLFQNKFFASPPHQPFKSTFIEQLQTLSTPQIYHRPQPRPHTSIQTTKKENEKNAFQEEFARAKRAIKITQTSEKLFHEWTKINGDIFHPKPKTSFM
ncbi:Hypothetical_protein [Hexamita inflata]|uniref:Hypothetical_protein n=1 Tax=Hexamita inflata TaxID=28002 RepID=A0AA86QZ99_9EUKA|nr:Hypothetical protein HINF_LOCUS3687 [Hexamita inflata]CAI9964011.1 Hypothetical protein HINF_LOCUS51656 [Hexamita inflata]